MSTFLEEKATEGDTIDTSQDKVVHSGSHTGLYIRTSCGSFEEILMPSWVKSESLVGAKFGAAIYSKQGARDNEGKVFSLPMFHRYS